MTNRPIFILIFYVAATSGLFGQRSVTVEEIALYHLDSLSKLKSQCDFLYFTNGYVENNSTYVSERIRQKFLNDSLTNVLIKNPLGDINIKDLGPSDHFSILNRLRGSKIDPILRINRHTKIGQFYFVGFGISKTGTSGLYFTIVMDNNGHLVHTICDRWVE